MLMLLSAQYLPMQVPVVRAASGRSYEEERMQGRDGPADEVAKDGRQETQETQELVLVVVVEPDQKLDETVSTIDDQQHDYGASQEMPKTTAAAPADPSSTMKQGNSW